MSILGEQTTAKIVIEAFAAIIALGVWTYKNTFPSIWEGALKRIKRHKEKTDPVLAQIKDDEIVNGMLHEMLEDYCADRAYIFQFHNGEKFYSGSHIQKFSCSHEVVREGISSKQHLLQKMLVSSVPFYMNDVVKEQAMYKDTSKLNSYALRVLCERNGIKSMIGIPIYKHGKIIGVFGMEWVRDFAGEFCETKDSDIENIFKNQVQGFNVYM